MAHPVPPGKRRASDPAPSRIRRFGRMLMHRGENATKEGDFKEAAVQFERAVRVWASILRRGEIEPGPFLHLIRLRRRLRQAAAPKPAPPAAGGLPITEGMPVLFRGTRR